MTRPFIIPATAATGPQVDFSAPTGKTLNKSMFGFSCSYWGGQHFTDAAFRATANAYLKPACLIFNPDWDLDGKYAAGDMTVINQLDRYDLAIDVLDRVPRLRSTSGVLRDRLKNQLIRHRSHVRTHGEDLPEVRDWQWSPGPGPSLQSAAAEREMPEG